ncbi:hypothetical protein SDC9_204278 [bioreactor metagenome]|uniref:Uncharacterized protein n=1 Tax=bioreactor metagenome TaxID=1076179 RepID=A0A645IYU2_9ZZZZ
MTNFIHHLTGVINRAVVGAQLDNGKTEWTCVTSPLRCHFADQFAQVALFKAVGIDPADKAVRVTCGFQIDRRCARLQ